MARHASGGEPIRLESDLRELASGPFVLTAQSPGTQMTTLPFKA
jgi:hypothetical protein